MFYVEDVFLHMIEYSADGQTALSRFKALYTIFRMSFVFMSTCL